VASRGSSSLSPQRKRIIAAIGTLAVFGGIIAVTQISNATENTGQTLTAAPTVSCPSVADKLPTVPDRARGEVDRELALLETQIKKANERLVSSQGTGDPNFVNNAILNPLIGKRVAVLERIEIAIGRFAERPTGLRELATCTLDETGTLGRGGDRDGEDNPDPNQDDPNEGEDGGLEVLANNCDNSNLEPHDGFQNGNRCVSTAFGEVGSRDRNPTLLITERPDQVGVNEPFSYQVSTRNLVRDRFLAAGDGGYYLESSLLNQEGLTRGHFHSACRILANENEAPASDPVPEFFVATEDGGGGGQPDQVRIEVAGLPTAGVYQCSSWAGDGSHRIPMMEAANQTPAFDSFRLRVG
jgi:hypothetical protein